MDWEQILYRRSYMTTTNGYQAMIWKTTTGEWSALVSQQSTAIAHNQFLVLKDAQSWCEKQATHLTASDTRFNDRKPGAYAGPVSVLLLEEVTDGM